MPTMAESAGMKPLSMAEAAGLTVVPPASSADAPIGPTIEGAKNLPQLPLSVLDRVKRGGLDIGQGLVQRGMQAQERLYGPTANTDLSVTRYPDAWNSAAPKAEVTPIKGPSTAEYTASVNRDLDDYNTRAKAQGAGIPIPGMGKLDIPRVLGSALATAPTLLIPGGQGLLGLAGQGALQGGAAGFAQFDPTNSATNVLMNTLKGGAAGAFMNPATNIVGNATARGVSSLGDRIRGLDRPTPTVTDMAPLPGYDQLPIDQQASVLRDAQAQAAQTGQMDTAALGRRTNLLSQGLTPTEGMVTRNAGTWTQERNLAKTLQQSPNPSLRAQGERLNNIFVQNDQVLGNGLRGLSSDLPRGSAEASGNTAMGVINDIQRQSQQQVGGLYRQIRDSVGDQVGARPNALLDSINDLSTSPAADPIVDAAHRFMVKKGILTKAEDGSFQPNGDMSITQAEALRQHINAQPNGFGKAQLINGLDRDVLDTAGGDAFAGPRGAAAARFDALGNPAVQRVLNTYGELGQGRTAQNFIQSQVIGAPVQDLQSLIGTVRSFGTPEQQQAFQGALQSGVMRHLEDSAIHPTTGQFSGMNLDKAMREVGDERLGLIFPHERLQPLQNLRQAAIDATVQPAHSAVNHSGSGALVLGMGHPNLSGPGLRAFLPDIAHEVLPSALTNAPQNIAGRRAVDNVLAARAMPAGTAPNATVLQLARALGVGSGAALAQQATQPNKAPAKRAEGQ